MSEHTPGPWHADEAGIVATGWGLVASLGAPEEYEFSDELPEAIQATVSANAHLIAAAPDLLAASQTVLAGLVNRIHASDQSAVPVFDGIADLHAAIARALGQTDEETK